MYIMFGIYGINLLLSNTVTKYPIKNETPDKNVIKYAITIKSLPCRL